jgi:hypothetical protein
MHSFKKRYRGNKPVIETEFVKGDGWFIELVRSVRSHLCFILYDLEGEKSILATSLTWEPE